MAKVAEAGFDPRHATECKLPKSSHEQQSSIQAPCPNCGKLAFVERVEVHAFKPEPHTRVDQIFDCTVCKKTKVKGTPSMPTLTSDEINKYRNRISKKFPSLNAAGRAAGMRTNHIGCVLRYAGPANISEEALAKLDEVLDAAPEMSAQAPSEPQTNVAEDGSRDDLWDGCEQDPSASVSQMLSEELVVEELVESHSDCADQQLAAPFLGLLEPTTPEQETSFQIHLLKQHIGDLQLQLDRVENQQSLSGLTFWTAGQHLETLLSRFLNQLGPKQTALVLNIVSERLLIAVDQLA